MSGHKPSGGGGSPDSRSWGKTVYNPRPDGGYTHEHESTYTTQHGGGESHGKGGDGCLKWALGGAIALGVGVAAVAWNKDVIGGWINEGVETEDDVTPGDPPSTTSSAPTEQAPAEPAAPHLESWTLEGDRLAEVIVSGLDPRGGPVDIAIVFQTEENLFGEGKACSSIGACLLRDQAVSDVANRHGHTDTEAVVITVPASQIDAHGILRYAIPRTLNAGEHEVDMGGDQSWIAVTQEPLNPQPGQEFRYNLEETAPQGDGRQMEFPNRSTW
ncbi:MAG: hypothetical protein KBD05_00405 [Candidatus Pacebacteria bacterium]|nr:hypothetical protein [Candidatus Paceibacterota bacterium]